MSGRCAVPAPEVVRSVDEWDARGGELHPFTLRFRDAQLETGFQGEEGGAGLAGYRIITGATVVLWAIAVFDFPVAIGIELSLSIAVGASMVVVGLKEGESPVADDYDIVGFTPMASSMSAAEVINLLSGLFSAFDDLVVERGLQKVKTIGDAYMAVGGLPEPIEDHAVRVVDLAMAMPDSARDSHHLPRLALRVGVHFGPVAGGVIGTQKFAYDVWGNTVNVAARLEQTGVPGRVHVSQDTMELTRDFFSYEAQGATELRGVGPWNP